MPKLSFASHLKRFFPNLAPLNVVAGTVAEAVAALEKEYPGLSAYLVDEHGAMRKHVSIYIGNEMIRDRKSLSDTLAAEDEVYFFQALSGG